MKQAKKIEAMDGLITSLPEEIIQHIQSFLTGKEAARTALLSKSWYNAWFTRPTLDFDEGNFKIPSRFLEIATKSMERYRDLNMKIQSFSLRTQSPQTTKIYSPDADKLTACAIKIGATDLNIVLPFSVESVLPTEFLGSETLARLCLSNGKITDGNVSWSRLKSLSLDGVRMGSDDTFRDIIISCCSSIEELSLSYLSRIFELNRTNLQELHKLRCLRLNRVRVGNLFFSDFASRFPCLKDLSLACCHGYTRIRIASTSLERVSSVQEKALKAEFEVPNIRKFIYSGRGLPPLCIKASASREWEFDISIKKSRLYKLSWFLSLKRLLTKLRPSRISLSLFISINRACKDWKGWYWEREDIQGVPKPVVVKNLTIVAPSAFCSPLLVGFLRVCRPTFITHSWETRSDLVHILETMKEKVATLNSSIRGENLIRVEFYDGILGEWRPLGLMNPYEISWLPLRTRKIRFQLSTRDLLF